MDTKDIKKKKTSFAAIIIIILMVILVLVGGSLFSYNQSFLSLIQSDLDQNNNSIKIIENNVKLFEDQLKDFNEKDINQSLELSKVIESSQNQEESMQDLSNQFNQFKNISDTHDDDWFLMRAEYFLIIAKNELSLYGRLQIIQEALIQAKNSLAQTDQSFIEINKLIELSLNRIEDAIISSDQEVILEKIDKIESKLLSQPDQVAFQEQAIDYDLSLPSMRNVMLNYWDALLIRIKSLILVRSNNDSQILKLRSEEKEIVRSLIHLNFELIRFYVLQNDATYRDAIDNCIEKIKGHYSDQNKISLESINDLLLLKKFTLLPEINEVNEALLIIQKGQR